MNVNKLNNDSITALIETYASSIRLPIHLVNSKGSYAVRDTDISLLFKEQSTNLLDVLNIALQIKKSVVVTPTDENIACYKYIISPLFQYSEESYTIIAGPFVEGVCGNNYVSTALKKGVQVLNETERDSAISKVNDLHYALMFVKSLRQEVASKDQLLTLYKKHLAHTDKSTLKEILDYAVKEGFVDFIGFAKKEENAVYKIESVNGKAKQMEGKSFFIGEGLLGHAAATEKVFYCEITKNPPKAGFFHQFDLYPQHVFGFPIYQSGQVLGIVFGGLLTNKSISKELTEHLQAFVQSAVQREYLIHQIKLADKQKAIHEAFLDLIDMIVITTDPINVLFSVMNVCHKWSKECLTIFTARNSGNVYKRGKDFHAAELEHRRCSELLFQTGQLIAAQSSQPGLIHKPITLNKQVIGLFTLHIKEEDFIEHHRLEEELNLLSEVLAVSFGSKRIIDLNISQEPIDLLFESLKELRPEEYNLTCKAIDLLKGFQTNLGWQESTIHELLETCKVVPYSLDFLHEKVSTDRLRLLGEYHRILNGEAKRGFLSAEAQLLVLAFSHLKGTTYSFNKFDKQLVEQFLEYIINQESQSRTAMEEIETTIGMSEIENLKDVKSVIAKLPLTSREKDVLYLILEGLNNQEVANLLYISAHTVKNHLTNIFRKLDVTDRVQAMAKIYRIKYEQ
ncbi:MULTISPECIES: LuxR C-terminal-related transcriptional regulator [Niallia]|uniref:LuxR C-terminal-related transcriptional regulator n=1 Tax=Niallia TaxID=2837506 RepID=UPI001EDC498B|nr:MULTISPECIES: LuxR C-terminal-related transcriptional regulator [Niallia]MED4037430.1 LuxR C-terminal-related transcriptional regulator [Niallia taxi]UPO91088.1 LuxR C-terminal-related transcriptional regulator [Niallia sp. Man26]